jgi:hypothetical protein
MLEHHADAAARASDGPDSTIFSPCQRISPSLGWINP